MGLRLKAARSIVEAKGLNVRVVESGNPLGLDLGVNRVILVVEGGRVSKAWRG